MIVRRMLWPLLLGLLSAAPVVAEQAPRVEVVTPERTLVRDELVTFGSLRSDESTMIRPEVDGRIATLHFREGQAVEAGALLVGLDGARRQPELAHPAGIHPASHHAVLAEVVHELGGARPERHAGGPGVTRCAVGRRVGEDRHRHHLGADDGRHIFWFNEEGKVNGMQIVLVAAYLKKA